MRNSSFKIRKVSIFALSVICGLCLCAGFVIAISAASKGRVSAAQGAEEGRDWYYSQLDKVAANLYDAMAEWHKAVGFAKGKGDIDLVAKNYVTEAQLKAYMGGDPSLSQAFLNARDAFINDNEELFYLDSTKLTLRVGQIDGKFAAFINSGENDNYYAAGFTNENQVKAAINETEAMLAEIATSMRKQLDIEFPKEDNAVYDPQRIVTLAHDALIAALEYTYQSAAAPHVAGVYAIKSGEANCVGYSSLFKSLMDKFGVPCLLVTGTAENSANVLEAHMWNYVKMHTTWYAVDVTWDDPIYVEKNAIGRDTYLLLGSNDFLSDHFETGIFSPGGKDFKYPELNRRNLGEIILDMESENDLKVYALKGFASDSRIYFSYKGMNMAELEKKGLYIAGQFCYYGQEPQPWVPMNAHEDTSEIKEFSMVPISRRGSIRFCVTNFDALNANGKPQPWYDEDLSLVGNHVAIADVFNIPYYSNYVAPPFIFTCEPTLTRKIEAKETEFTVIYDEELVADEGKELEATVLSSENIPGKLTDLKMEKTTINKPGAANLSATRVTFKFTPDNSYQSYINRYSIRLDNVKGKTSKKPPNQIPVCVGFDMSIPCPTMVSTGYSDNKAFVIALPTLVVNPNADIFEYDGNQDAAALDIRLVATIPGKEKQENFEQLSGETDIKASSVYDLSLACQNYMARLKSDANYNLTVGIPYPEGYNYNSDPTVQFKAYHYKLVDGQYVAEEIVCRIGERGLEVVVDSFSPFLIAVVPKSDDAPTKKLVNVAVRSHGGDVVTTVTDKNGAPVETSTSGLYAIEQGNGKTFTIRPSAGYVVDKVLLNNKIFTPAGNTVSLTYDSMENDNDLEVFFIAETVKTQEGNKGFVTIVGSLERAVLALQIARMPGKTTYTKGETLDVSGMLVRELYNDATVLALDAAEYTIAGADFSTAGTKTITVTSKSQPGIKTTFTVNVVDPDNNNSVVLFVCIAGAVLLVLASGFTIWWLVRRKKLGR